MGQLPVASRIGAMSNLVMLRDRAGCTSDSLLFIQFVKLQVSASRRCDNPVLD